MIDPTNPEPKGFNRLTSNEQLRDFKAKTYAEAVKPYAAAIRMVRDAIGEVFGPAASLESAEATLLRGPEPRHDAEAIIEALQRVKEEQNRLVKLLDRMEDALEDAENQLEGALYRNDPT